MATTVPPSTATATTATATSSTPTPTPQTNASKHGSSSAAYVGGQNVILQLQAADGRTFDVDMLTARQSRVLRVLLEHHIPSGSSSPPFASARRHRRTAAAAPAPAPASSVAEDNANVDNAECDDTAEEFGEQQQQQQQEEQEEEVEEESDVEDVAGNVADADGNTRLPQRNHDTAVQCHKVPLPTVSSRALAKVIEYCYQHRYDHVGALDHNHHQLHLSNNNNNNSNNNNNNDEEQEARNAEAARRFREEATAAAASMVISMAEWDARFIDVDQETLFEIIMAANYLNISSLLDLGCKTVANMIRGKSAEEICKHFNIECDLTEEDRARIRREDEWAIDPNHHQHQHHHQQQQQQHHSQQH